MKLKWYLQENPAIFRGLSVAQVPLRYYPYRTLGAHIYGQLSEIGPKQLKDPRFHDYHRGDVIGQSGVERRYDAFLRGVDGIDAVTVDAFGQPTGAVRHLKAPVPGRNVRLTIDLDTQRAAEQALAYGVRSNASEGADAGAIVALDPKNGEVRALASFPTFDPNWFISYRKPKFQAQLARITRNGGEPAHYPLLDRAIAGRYPAASTFKPFVAIAAVKERRVTPDQTLPCTPSRYYYEQALQQLGHTVRRPHQPDRRARALVRHLLLPASATTIFRESGKQGHPLQDWAAQVRLRQHDRHRHRGRGPGPAADAGLEDGLLQGELLGPAQAVVRPQLAVRLELERRRRDQPLDRPGQPQRHAAAARRRLRRDRERRHRRDAARRRAPSRRPASRRASSPRRRRRTINIGGHAADGGAQRAAARDAPAGGHGDATSSGSSRSRSPARRAPPSAPASPTTPSSPRTRPANDPSS